MNKPVQSEADFMAMVIKLAKDHGWLVYHTRPAMMRSGKWASPTQGNVGWPDLFLARRADWKPARAEIQGKDGHPKPRALAAELKSEKGKLTEEQRAWLEALNAAGIEVRVWRPSQWAAIVKELT